MLRLENWGDLFKYNRELLEDDFNKDQSLVVKSKTRSIDGSSVNISGLLTFSSTGVGCYLQTRSR